MDVFIAILTKMIDGLQWIRRRCEPRSSLPKGVEPGLWLDFDYSFQVDWFAVDHRCKKCKKGIPSCLTSKCSLEVTPENEAHSVRMVPRGFRRLPTS